MGFTHIELLPVTEHPFDGSWGYQPIGLYAPTSRFGTPRGLRALRRRRCHAAGIGVHPGLGAGALPDRRPRAGAGSTARALYEYADPREGFHQRLEHADLQLRPHRGAQLPGRQRAVLARALRHRRPARRRRGLDAVPRLQPQAGEWVPNVHGGRENLEAIDFLQAHERAWSAPSAPAAVTIAEESTAFPACRARPTHGGLGFHFKWNMGWMHDTLQYIGTRPGPPQLPPRRDDLRPGLRVQRELRAAALARRGGARQGLAARQDAGRPLAAVRQPARALRLHVGPSRQEAAVHGLRVRAGARVEPRPQPRLAPAGRPAARRACSAWCATSTGSTAHARRCTQLDCDADGFEWIDHERRRAVGARASCARGRRRRASWWWCATSRRCRATATASACRAAGRYREIAQHRRRGATAAAASATPRRGRCRAAAPGTAARSRSLLTLPPLATRDAEWRREPHGPTLRRRSDRRPVDEPARPARGPALSAGRHAGTAGRQFRGLLAPTPTAVELCLFDARRRARTGAPAGCRPAPTASGTATCRRRGRAWSTACARTAPGGRDAGPPLQRRQAAARPLCARDRRPLRWRRPLSRPRPRHAGAARSRATTPPIALKARVRRRRAFDWAGDGRRASPLADTVLYELHVQGLHPRCIPSVPRGAARQLCRPGRSRRRSPTCSAWASPRSSLLPVHNALDEAPAAQGLRNYWGYNTSASSRPSPRYWQRPARQHAARRVPRTWSTRCTRAASRWCSTWSTTTRAESRRTRPDAAACAASTTRCYYRLRPDDPRALRELDRLRQHARLPPAARAAAGDGQPALLGRRDAASTASASTWRRCWARGDARRLRRATRLLRRRRAGPGAGARVKLIAEPWDIGPGGYQVGRLSAAAGSSGTTASATRMRGFWLHARREARGEFALRLRGIERRVPASGRRADRPASTS